MSGQAHLIVQLHVHHTVSSAGLAYLASWHVHANTWRPLMQVEVRALAKAAGLPNQARRDSQGICFLGKVKFSEFVEQHLGVWPGCIIEEETGEVLGYHQGFWFHTVGQRRGIPLNGGPW